MSASSRKKKQPEPSLGFTGPIEGWVVNYITRNGWKVAATMERGELVSEAWIVYEKVSARYPGVEKAHLMALFKTSWHRRFLDLANRDTASRALFVQERTVVDDDGDEVSFREPVGETDNAGSLAFMVRDAVREAPREVGMVLQLLLSAPQELVDCALSTWQGAKADRADGGSLRLNQLLGFAPSYDCIGAVRSYFERPPV